MPQDILNKGKKKTCARNRMAGKSFKKTNGVCSLLSLDGEVVSDRVEIRA